MSVVEAHAQVNKQIDDLLATIYLVRDNNELVERLFDQLVNDLVELTFLETHLDFEEGVIDLRDFQEQIATLTRQCRAMGLPHQS
ncbi:MAG: hypothetical protein HYR89_01860 [Actinobacteria bacterium]|nr:hypothetical protein [Actinomycetota bacterium]MBI3256578.1 hypothetical protein [Actinomycetota bacterium]